MHDCFGKPITPGCKVRAATKEELDGQGHTDFPASLTPSEQFAFPQQFDADTCNVIVVRDVTACAVPETPEGGNPRQEIRMFTSGPFTLHTARTLVRIG